MADPARRRMTPEEFFEWQSAQDGLYELVDGVPVPHVKMMTGASVQHDHTRGSKYLKASLLRLAMH